HMVQLAEATQETVKLTVVDGHHTVIAHVVEGPTRPVIRRERGPSVIAHGAEGPRSLRTTGRGGERTDLHRGAPNTVLAAVQAALADQLSSDGALLRRELETIALRGYAVSHGEVEPGVTSLSVPIRGPSDEVEASLSVLGPSLRVTDDQWPRWLELLRAAAV